MTNSVDFDTVADCLIDPSEIERRLLFEILETIRRKLRPGEFIMACDAMDGWTQSDLAGKYNITQQAVCARLKKIRAKLEPVFIDRE